MGRKIRRDDNSEDDTVPEDTAKINFWTFPLKMMVRQVRIHLHRINWMYFEANAFVLGNLLLKSASIWTSWQLTNDMRRLVDVNLGLFALQILFDLLLTVLVVRQRYIQLYHWHQFLFIAIGFINSGIVLLSFFYGHVSLKIVAGILMVVMCFFLIRNASNLWVYRQAGIMSIFLQYTSLALLFFIRASEPQMASLASQLYLVGLIYLLVTSFRALFYLFDVCDCLSGTGFFFCVWTNLAVTDRKRSRWLILMDLAEDGAIGLYLTGFKGPSVNFLPAQAMIILQMIAYLFTSGFLCQRCIPPPPTPSHQEPQPAAKRPLVTIKEMEPNGSKDPSHENQPVRAEAESNLAQIPTPGIMGQFFGQGEDYFSRLARERARQNESKLCFICCTEEANTIFRPCQHRGTCETCTLEFMKLDTRCPLDRLEIDRFIVVRTVRGVERVSRRYQLVL